MKISYMSCRQRISAIIEKFFIQQEWLIYVYYSITTIHFIFERMFYIDESSRILPRIVCCRLWKLMIPDMHKNPGINHEFIEIEFYLLFGITILMPVTCVLYEYKSFYYKLPVNYFD